MQNIVSLLPSESLISPVLDRQGYGTHTFYVTNPNQAQFRVQTTPDLVNWFDLVPVSTETQAIIHSLLNCRAVRAVQDSTDPDLVVRVVSGGLAQA